MHPWLLSAISALLVTAGLPLGIPGSAPVGPQALHTTDQPASWDASLSAADGNDTEENETGGNDTDQDPNPGLPGPGELLPGHGDPTNGTDENDTEQNETHENETSPPPEDGNGTEENETQPPPEDNGTHENGTEPPPTHGNQTEGNETADPPREGNGTDENHTLDPPDDGGQADGNHSWGNETPTEPLPDLLIRDITWNHTVLDPPMTGDMIRFHADVFNDGDQTAPPTSIRFEIDGDPLGTVESPNLAANASATVTSPRWHAQQGDHTIQVVADPHGNMEESDETNNERDETIHVLPVRVQLP